MTSSPIALMMTASLLAMPALADSVAVETEQPREETVPVLLAAYGSAMPALDGGMTLSFQQDGRVLAIPVTPGETVHNGDRLLDFAASAAAVSTYQQAVTAVTVARQQRAHAAQLLGQQLATRDQLAQADKAVADAQVSLDALQREGADRSSRTLTAPFDGIIASIPVAPGDRVQSGATLMTVTRLDGLVVTVGIEPSARARVHAGETVQLTPLTDGPPIEGHVVRIDGLLNPRTRLLDVDVAVPPGAVISGTAYRSEITTGEITGWVVPHDAVLMDDKGAYLFQVAGTTASRVNVRVTGISGAADVVEGMLDSRQPVVVQGNYQLSDKGLVRMSNAQ
jgi:membrane fusion protein (multidrug efflux system)